MPFRSERTLAVGGVALAVVLIGAAVWWRASRMPADALSVAASDADSRDVRNDGAFVLRMRLLPDAGVSASSTSVRVGAAAVSPDDEAAYRAWQRGGREGAGPAEYGDLATVTRWTNAPARALADGRVEVGPIALPAAPRYALQARADDGLRFYEAHFARGDAPAEVRPRVAAGLRVRAPNGADPAGIAFGVLFRRVAGSEDAAWQSLLRRETPALLDAFDERAWPVSGETRIAPLPPGPIDVVAVANGVETERRRVVLIAGRYVAFDLDPAAAELGAALSSTVALRLVEAGSGAPVREALAVWLSPRGEVRVRADAKGVVRLPGVDLSGPLRLELRFESKESSSLVVDALPRWPERIALALDLDDARAVGDTLEKTVALQPLRWLIVETPGIDVPRRPRVDDPFPVFVLQRAEGATWRDASAEAFRPVDEGIAVSLDAPGRVRVAAAIAPWRIAYSDAVESRTGDARRRTRLRATGGRDLSLRFVADARPLAFAPVRLVSPLRGVPPKTMTTDAAGRVVLPGANAPALRAEAPGFEQVEVRLDRVESNRAESGRNETDRNETDRSETVVSLRRGG
ncbi:MAG: hypothetical protein E6Q50_05565 [Lysobacter sp.]|nr:MAG: hypothetical protein E6Q50_05565 [Lysobacter sp.]